MRTASGGGGAWGCCRRVRLFCRLPAAGRNTCSGGLVAASTPSLCSAGARWDAGASSCAGWLGLAGYEWSAASDA